MKKAKTKKSVKKSANLNDLRDKINSLDEKIVKLMNNRANMSVAIGEHKRETAQAIYSPAREKEVFERLKSLNKGPMKD